MRKLLHVAVHGGINQNAGDTLLTVATRQLFDRYLGESDWHLHQAWEPLQADEVNRERYDGIVVGGGGMLLPDQDGAEASVSGWQWNISLPDLEALQAPLIVFGIGYNRFRGQKDFAPVFGPHIRATAEKAAFFGVRNLGSAQALYPYGIAGLSMQPCPTTCLWQLYPEIALEAQQHDAYGPRVLGINIAMDRSNLRFPDGLWRAVIVALIQAARHWRAEGWHIKVLCHKPGDMAIVSPLVNAGITPTVTRLWDVGPRVILHAYTATDVVVGIRGHAQLIPFGLRKRIISLITHDKLGWFLEDVGLASRGVDVHASASIADDLAATLHGVAEEDTLAAKIAGNTAQDTAWRTTCTNMFHIAGILAPTSGYSPRLRFVQQTI